MQKVKETKELHTGEYNSIMEIFKYSPVTYCSTCGGKKYSSLCKCKRLPITIGKAVSVKFFKKPVRKNNGSREKS
tara:strand:- start:4375 stop:4599 length:225 start_codon:yes stop_codon:yes gene_type:complete